MAASLNEPELLKALLGAKADVNSQSDDLGWTPLSSAVSGDVKCVRILLEHGAKAPTVFHADGSVALYNNRYREKHCGCVYLREENYFVVNSVLRRWPLQKEFSRRRNRLLIAILVTRNRGVGSILLKLPLCLLKELLKEMKEKPRTTDLVPEGFTIELPTSLEK